MRIDDYNSTKPLGSTSSSWAVSFLEVAVEGGPVGVTLQFASLPDVTSCVGATTDQKYSSADFINHLAAAS